VDLDSSSDAGSANGLNARIGTMKSNVWLAIVKVMKTKSAKDISLPFFLMVLVGVLLYEIYITNTVSVVCVSIMVILILKYGKTHHG
jgi:hypothetical protein